MPIDRRALAKWFPILLGACGGARPAPAPAPNTAAAAPPTAREGNNAATTTAPAASPPHKVYCWLVHDPRCPAVLSQGRDAPWRGC